MMKLIATSIVCLVALVSTNQAAAQVTIPYSVTINSDVPFRFCERFTNFLYEQRARQLLGYISHTITSTTAVAAPPPSTNCIGVATGTVTLTNEGYAIYLAIQIATGGAGGF